MAIPWPPPEPPCTVVNPQHQPLTVLRALFDWAYRVLPCEILDLPSREQSNAVLRAVARASKSIQLPCPGLGWYPELKTIAALSNVDIEDLLADLNHLHPGDDFLAARLDPRGRRGRRWRRPLAS